MRAAWLGIGLIGLLSWGCLTLTWAQDGTKSKSTSKTGRPANKKKAANTPALDAKANQLQTDFVSTAETLANDYYEAGNYDKAKTLLRTILTLNPQQANIEAKLKLLDEELINANSDDIDVNPSDGWTPSGYVAIEGKPLRFKAEGNYKFVVSMALTPKGYTPVNAPNDYVPELPAGALIGIIIPPETDQTGSKDRRQIKEKAFLIGDSLDMTPQKSGILFLRVNTPPDNKNTGRLKVRISGQVQKISG